MPAVWAEGKEMTEKKKPRYEFRSVYRPRVKKSSGTIHSEYDCMLQGCHFWWSHARTNPKWGYESCRDKCDGHPIKEDEEDKVK